MLDDYRRESDDLPTRPEAIRRCVAKHLQAAGHPVTNESSRDA